MAALLKPRHGLPNVARRRLAAGARERGEILLITLVCLLICLLGLIYAMRGAIIDSQVTGNNLARQKDVQSSDIALRMVTAQILAAYKGQPLELSAAGQLWWRDVPAATAAPNAAYWAACLGNADTTLRCAQLTLSVNGSALPYQALVVVQPTGRIDATACSLAQFQAIYYDIHLRVTESSGTTGATTETVYKLCTYS